MPLPNLEDFLDVYNIESADFSRTGLIWEELRAIHRDYCGICDDLDTTGINLLKYIMKIQNVHSVRYRVKQPEHLIEKIIRKRILEPHVIINLENYQDKIRDLIGLRAIHLVKEEWAGIHDNIMANLQIDGKPEANYRKGDPEEYIEFFRQKGCEIREHSAGYRSVHYSIVTPAKKPVHAELQVRTIFDEAWSEIDHKVRYPYHINDPMFKDLLSIMSRLAGSADEMSSFIVKMKG